jgi:hypothetical protein
MSVAMIVQLALQVVFAGLKILVEHGYIEPHVHESITTHLINGKLPEAK